MDNNTIKQNRIPVIILCGGVGTRLREETEFKPKPMVEIGAKPILWHIMKIYAHYGYRDFILALGYKGNYIKEYFIKQKYYEADFTINTGRKEFSDVFCGDEFLADNFNITFSDTGLETPHGERILKVKKYVNEDIFMATYGDGLADIDINKLLKFHKEKNKIATITGVHPVSRWGLVKVNSESLITQFVEKPMLYDYVNGGFMVFKKEFFDHIRPGDLVENALARLIPLGELALYKHEGFFYGMDTYRDFLLLNDLWAKDPKWKIWQN